MDDMDCFFMEFMKSNILFVGKTPWMGFMESYDHSIVC